MRVTLDLDHLLAEGRITADEAERLKTLAAPGRAASVLIQVLYILGALGLAGGVVLLKPDPASGIALAVIALVAAAFAKDRADLAVLSNGLSIAGTIGLCGAFALQVEDAVSPLVIHAVMTGLTLLSALFFESLFLIALVPLGMTAMLGSGAAYWHAAYGVFIEEPALNAILFAALTGVLFAAGARLTGIRAKQADVAARVSWLITNFALWIGSLWGDTVGNWFARQTGDVAGADPLKGPGFEIPDWQFVLVWAAVSLGVIAGFKSNRFVVNASVTFLAINAYTQFFERFSGNPLSLIAGGASLLAAAYGLFRFDRWAESKRAQ